MAWLIALDLILANLPRIIGGIILLGVGIPIILSLFGAQPAITGGIAGLAQLIPMLGSVITLMFAFQLMMMLPQLIRSIIPERKA